MASGLQFRKTGTSYGLPSRRVPEATATQTLLPRLTAHTIPHELLGCHPRWVRLRQAHSARVALGAVATFACLVYLYVAYRGPQGGIGRIDMPLMQGVLIGSLLAWHDHTENRRNYGLLRTGDAVPAIVTSLEKESRVTTVRVWYLTKSGEIVSGSVVIPTQQVAEHQLAPDSILTLLLSNGDKPEIMPYCIASRRYEVLPVEATQVSRNVSARLLARAAAVPASPATRYGVIEPELLGATPRPVRTTRSHQKTVVWLIAFVSLAMTLNAIAPTPAGLKAFFYIICGFAALLFALPFGSKALRDGVPARAVVIGEAEGLCAPRDGRVTLRYEYRAKGRLRAGTLTETQSRVRQLGLCAGAAFTVLYLPESPEASAPYFGFKASEIIGAGAPTITPPTSPPVGSTPP